MSGGATPRCLSCGVEGTLGLTNLTPCAPDTYLCRDCAATLQRCFASRKSSGNHVSVAPPACTDTPTPAELVTMLDKAVIGQIAAKRALATACWKHLQRTHGNTAAPRAHVLLHGPTGCGKTRLARTAAKLLDVPFVSLDATSFSETGYSRSERFNLRAIPGIL